MSRCKILSLGIIGILCAHSPVDSADLKARLFETGLDPVQQQMINTTEVSSQFLEGASASGSGILPSRKKVSQNGAMLRSLLIPGWGEHYLDYPKTARAFFWTDVTLWAAAISFEAYSLWKEDQFISFATTHAGAQMSGKSDGFYADIGNYSNTETYNEAKLRNRYYDALYNDPSYYWAWDSDQNRMEYDHMRIQSRAAHNKIFFFIGMAALNRMISFIDSGKKARDVQKRNKSLQLGFQVQPETQGDSSGFRLLVSAGL